MPPAKRAFIRQPRTSPLSRKIASNPPSYVKLPWYKFTFETTYPQGDQLNIPVNTTVANVIDQIKTRLLFANDTSIRIKVSNAMVWNTCTSNLGIPDIQTTFQQLAPGGVVSYPRAQLDDSGTLNMPAKMMFKWPITDKTTILDFTNDGAKTIVATRGKTPGSRITVRINVWFQSGTVA